MNNKLDDFSRDLATGMSRRSAFLKFLGGAGALGFLGLGAGLQKSEAAPTQAQCVNACLILADELYDICQIECDIHTGYKVTACFNACFTGVDEFGYAVCAFRCTHPAPVVPAGLNLKERSRALARRIATSMSKAASA